MKIYDATNKILGRLCSIVAKDLLNGEEVFVVNVEKAVISGEPQKIIEKYKIRRSIGDPHKGPFFPRYPDEIFRRTVRGMLPFKKPKGRKAFKRLKVFIGLPEEFKNKELINLREIDAKKIKKTKTLSLEELALRLGAKKRW